MVTNDKALAHLAAAVEFLLRQERRRCQLAARAAATGYAAREHIEADCYAEQLAILVGRYANLADA